jgi:hypothetical protein
MTRRRAWNWVGVPGGQGAGEDCAREVARQLAVRIPLPEQAAPGSSCRLAEVVPVVNAGGPGRDPSLQANLLPGVPFRRRVERSDRARRCPVPAPPATDPGEPTGWRAPRKGAAPAHASCRGKRTFKWRSGRTERPMDSTGACTNDAGFRLTPVGVHAECVAGSGNGSRERRALCDVLERT